MRMLKLLPLLMFAVIAVGCGKKNADSPSSTTTTTVQPVTPVTPLPVTPVDFTTGCTQYYRGQVYGNVCAVPVSGGYTQSSGITFSLNYYWSVSAQQGLIVQGSGSASVSVGGTNVALNSRASGLSGSLRISTSGNHSLQVWLVQCLNTSYQAVSCSGF